MDNICQQEIKGWRIGDGGEVHLFQAPLPSQTRYEEAVLVLRSDRAVTIGMYTLPVELFGSPHVVRVLVDINRRREMERQTGILGHFEQIGAIAASIAHELQRIIERTEQRLQEALGTESPAAFHASPNASASGAAPARSFPDTEAVLSNSPQEDALDGIRKSGEMLNHLLNASCFTNAPKGMLDVNASLQAIRSVRFCQSRRRPGNRVLRHPTPRPKDGSVMDMTARLIASGRHPGNRILDCSHTGLIGRSREMEPMKRFGPDAFDLPRMTGSEARMAVRLLIATETPCCRSHLKLWSAIAPKAVNLCTMGRCRRSATAIQPWLARRMSFSRLA
jgi:hypothetical protein